MPVSTHRVSSPRRVAREDLVEAQYGNPAAVAGYAASYESSRYFHSRLHVIDEVLDRHPGGNVLDVGCGPGMFVQHLLDSRPGDFSVTACDRSPAMIDAASERLGNRDGVRLSVARIEEMPFGDNEFDVVVAMGVLEYVDAEPALREIARVVRPGGVVAVTMLNPASPYRLFEWGVYWPASRLLGRASRLLRGPASRRSGPGRSGIRALGQARLCRLMRDVGLTPEDVVHYDLTALVPPIDRLTRHWRRGWHDHPERTATRGPQHWLGTAYLVASRRSAITSR